MFYIKHTCLSMHEDNFVRTFAVSWDGIGCELEAGTLHVQDGKSNGGR